MKVVANPLGELEGRRDNCKCKHEEHFQTIWNGGIKNKPHLAIHKEKNPKVQESIANKGCMAMQSLSS
jgi:hypothetical protein